MTLDGQTLILFMAAIALMCWASAQLTTALERIGARLGFSEGLLGIVAALGADAPEISSAFAALRSDHHEIGLGVVLGSNIFNLAGLLGVSAVVAGRVSVGRQGLWFNGGTSLLVSVVAMALLLQWIPAGLSLLLLGLLLVPYVTLTAMQPGRIDALRFLRVLSVAVGHGHRHARRHADTPPGTWGDGARALLCVVLIIAASLGAVDAAVRLGSQWGVNHRILGMLVLAPLTSVPNMVAAVRLAREGRGDAVVSEALNSNTLNILVGICLPALLMGFATPAATILFTALWLLGMKIVTLAVASHRKGLHRAGGVLIIGMYAAFAVVLILWH
jgi:cation:H+ antiporter